jgi:hypothetical protein
MIQNTSEKEYLIQSLDSSGNYKEEYIMARSQPYAIHLYSVKYFDTDFVKIRCRLVSDGKNQTRLNFSDE